MYDISIGDVIEYSPGKYGLIVSVKISSVNNELELSNDIFLLWVLDESGELVPVVFSSSEELPKSLM